MVTGTLALHFFRDRRGTASSAGLRLAMDLLLRWLLHWQHVWLPCRHMAAVCGAGGVGVGLLMLPTAGRARVRTLISLTDSELALVVVTL